MSYICCICEEPIPDEVIAARHYSVKYPMPTPEEMVCSRGCSTKLKASKGAFKGKPHQIAQSNSDNPRRKKH